MSGDGNKEEPIADEGNNGQQDEPSGSSSRPKWKRGKKKKLEGRIIIMEIDEDGEPIAPHNAKTKLVNQIGFLVKDNIPISFQKLKSPEIDESIASTSMVPISMVPKREKEMIWEQIKENFTFEGVDEAKVKDWSFQKGAIAFQTYKKNLNKDYIKKGLTPDFMKHLKKEDDIIARGIVPQILEWLKRVKHWYYAHGGTLNSKDGSFVFAKELREAATRLVELIKATTNGSFMPDREKDDELTMALGNLEHPGCCRGKGVIPWKFAFREHIDSYRSCQRKLLELVNPVKNKLIMVAYGVAEQPTQGQTIHGVEIPALGYAKVGVDRVVDGWDDLKLEIPRGDGEKNLEESIHGWILWPKRYIRITQLSPPTLGSSPQGSRARSPMPSAWAPSPLPDRDPSISPPVERDPSMSPRSPLADRDASMSPPPPIMILPTAATKKKQNKLKEKQPEPKKPYDMTNVELHTVVDAEVKAHLTTKPPMNKDPPLDKVLSEFDKNLLLFAKDTNLTPAQLRGEDHVSKHPGVAKSKFEFGKSLVWPQLVDRLPTKMYKLHQWYMEASANSLLMLEVRIGDQHYFCGEDILKIPLEELYFLYNQDALDKLLISSWVLMEIQTCRRKGYYDIGFIDPVDQSVVYIMDSFRKSRDQYKNLIDILNKAWARFCRHHADMMEALLVTEKIRAIQEQLSGFLLDKVVNPAGEFHSNGSNLHHC
uniref:DUF8039 domain-containing protein n=1 Tax=Setaria viridis TaxID=4556 RepID=A0A4U6VRW2_SETVI|nr:hypothetical protein SEVIR_2G175300v2 [Setaria viridis]